MWQQVKQALVDSAARFLTRFASLLPGLAVLFVAAVLSVIAAWILTAIVRRLLVSVRFDERMNRLGFVSLAEWSPRNSPARLVSRLIGALIILSGFLLGLAAFDFQWTYLFVRNIFGYIPHVFAALLVLLVGNVVARFLARSLLIGAVNLNFQHARFLSVGVKWIVIVLASAMALEHLRIAPRIVELAFAILFGGIVLTLSLVVGLRSKELIAKSLEHDASQAPKEPVEDSLRHL